ncbi:MAG: hydantoinase B/oxoprolinase family protein [Sporichthyaceae bacterium]
MSRRWQFWIDRGGTFTDVVGADPSGGLVGAKLLSRNPERYRDAATAGIRRLLGLPDDAPIPAERIEVVRIGTTVATNALLERRGTPTVLVTTAGHTDALRIGRQDRPDIFARHIVRPEPLPARTVAYDERVAADGTVLRAPDLGRLRADLGSARDAGLQAVAIACLHGHLYPAHELLAAEVARDVGFAQISCSSQVNPLQRLLPRAETTVVDAYLTPVLRAYLDGLAAELPGVRLLVMGSHGGLADAAHVRGVDAVLSGPAGGIVAMAQVARSAGRCEVVGFDMGGTSTDVSAWAGAYERRTDNEVAGVRLRTPMLAIHTIAAGGGSILSIEDGRYRVGPRSAGADPGPVAYRRGGPLTLTDANVLLGRIHPTHFPAVFGPTGTDPLDATAVRHAFAELSRAGAQAIEASGAGEPVCEPASGSSDPEPIEPVERRRSGTHDSRNGCSDARNVPVCGAVSADTPAPEAIAAGFRRVAVEQIADALRTISVRKGRDLANSALVCFGGAGGQHACAVAEALGMDTVLVPPLSGLLCAVGIGAADLTAIAEQAVERPLAAAAELTELVEDLVARTNRSLQEQGADPAEVITRVLGQLRYQGSDTALGVPWGEPDAMRRDAAAAHRAMFSFDPDADLVVESIRVEAAVHSRPTTARPAETATADDHLVPMYVDGAWVQARLLQRDALNVGQRLDGPAIVVEDGATTVVEAGWTARAEASGHLVLARSAGGRAATVQLGESADPVLLEVFANRFMAIAEQMGARLAATARSVNIKERLDFSCAVFDGHGQLVANAPHMPVHLGSMGACVAGLIDARAAEFQPGDVYACNDPYRGGTHLPDVTVVMPVYPSQVGLPDHIRPAFYLAARGHHAEIGGSTPGSMPSDSRTVAEEGVVFDAHLLVRGGAFRAAETAAVLQTGPMPSRAVEVNLADLRAQVASLAAGLVELKRTVEEFSLEVVSAYAGWVLDTAEAAVRDVLGDLTDGQYSYEMDNGATIAVQVAVDHVAREAVVDFAGSSAQLDTNFNAPRSIVTAAVLYVFRTLISRDIPLNDGCLRPLHIRVPARSLLSPEPPAAVVAGNVETSQAITGALYAALGVAAEGSGTMNNVTFGNADAQYYETVASGSGAGPGYDGTPVVQTHMTNSRLTDPEVLEARFPVLVEEFSIREGTGGAGRNRGGDGALRRLRFTEPVTVSLLSGHRRVPPYGLAGGEPGALGVNRLQKPDGTQIHLAGCDRVDAEAGDVLSISTPGGGGWGKPEA